MKKVIKVLDNYDDNKTRKDGFIILLEDGERREISNTAWQTVDKKIVKANGDVVFEDSLYFDKKLVDLIV